VSARPPRTVSEERDLRMVNISRPTWLPRRAGKPSPPPPWPRSGPSARVALLRRGRLPEVMARAPAARTWRRSFAGSRRAATAD